MTPAAAVARAVLVLGAVLLAVTLGARGLSPLPDLALVLVVAWALLRGPLVGAAAGLATGWLVDLVPPGPTHLGVTALVHAAAGYLAGRARVEGPVAAPRVAVVALGAAALVEAVAVVGALAVSAPVDLAEVALRCLLTATAAAVVVPLVVGAERSLVRRRFG
ncbi:rod shape-determining protein MreD [Oryzobacter terrae]|uniref:rod shape-determining protein MreD n=1 Tax=Oryzobacter terrae TaxID=1620385 RepID=UPI00366AA687